MVESVLKSFDVWTDAQGVKSKGRVKSIDNISLEGIARLRELILDLAIRGKLVEQDGNDEPASLTLKKTVDANQKLIKEGKLKKIKALPDVEEREFPFELPKGWVFVRLNEVGEWGAGATPNRSNDKYYGGDIPWFKSGELVGDYIDSAEEFITELALKETSLRYNSVGDVLLAMYGATIGKSSILKVRATTNQAVCACTPFGCISNRFLLTLLKAYKPRFTNMGAGGAQPNISREKIIATVIALPPLAEQGRIVAKVDELMALCDKLEQAQTLHLKTHQTLVKTVLQTLTDAPDAAEVEKAWQRLCPHFDTLFCTEDGIDQLKQTVLQLAIMGRLVKQNSNDERAGELLKRIEKEKAKAVKEGKLKKQAPLPEIGEEEKPFALPNGWEWVRLGEIIELVSGQHVEAADWNDKKDGYPYLTGPSDFGDTNPIFSRWTKKPKVFAKKGDILITVKGSGVGKLNLLHEDNVAIGRQLMAVRIRYIERGFVSLFLQNNFHVFQNDKMGIAIPGISREDILEKAFPLPPLHEQKRIVSKISELMKFCEQLKSQIKKAEDTKLLLSKTIVENAVA